MLMRSWSSSILLFPRISEIQKLKVCAYVVSEAVVDYVRDRARGAYVWAVETIVVVDAMIVAVPAVMLLRKA